MRRNLIYLTSFLMGLVPLSVPAGARSVIGAEHGWCGTDGYHSRLLEAEAKKRWFEKRSAGRMSEGSRLTSAGAIKSAQSVRKEGVVAVIEDDGSIVASRNLFDFSNNSVNFFKKKSKLRAKATSATIHPDFGNRIENGDWGGCDTIAPVDDDSFLLDLPFRVKFYGTKYSEIWVNSDGNLTFGSPDCASSERGLTRVLSGPPRILPFFGDLDPAVTSGERGVFVNQRKNNVQVTWNQVPQFGTSNTNTFQVTVFKTGKITVAFGAIDAPGSIVGASPGEGTSVEIVDFSDDLPVAPTQLAILERYSETNLVDEFGVAATFFEHFKDIYDHLIIWLDFPASLGGAFAFEITIKNEVEGIGLGQFDFTEFVGSDSRLRSLVQMGDLARYPADPNRDVPRLGTNTTMDVLGQEAGHRWLAFTRVSENGATTDEILGRDLAHWSFFFDSDESDMEGNDIMELPGGLFQTMGATSRFSALDQYIMGLIPPEDVGPQFFVRNGSNPQPESPPQIGVEFGGQRVDFTVDNIIDEEGPRVPAAADAPKSFKMAFILVALDGQAARPESIAKVKKIANTWVSYFKSATDGNGSVSVKLKKRRK